MVSHRTVKKPVRRKLTKAVCTAAKYIPATRPGRPPRRHVIWDTELKGFGLRVFPSGVKVFVLSYRDPAARRKRLLTLGRFGALTVDQARKKARSEHVKVSAGIDPAIKVEPVRTFGELADKWLDDYAKKHLRKAKESEQLIDKYLRPAFGSRALTQVTQADARTVHTRIGRHAKIQANRVMELLRAIYYRGEKWGIVPAGTPNPARGVERYQEKSRDRWLTDRELGRLLRALDREDSETQAIVMLLLLTGCRKSEILSAEWRNVDLPAARLLLPETKNDEARVVQLSDEAVEIIRQLPRALHSDYVFPGRGGKSHLKDIKRPWERIRKRARLHNVRIHDLRRTVGSQLAQAGVSLEIIGKALGHKSTRATKVYARIADAQPRDALNLIGKGIAALEQTRKRARRS